MSVEVAPGEATQILLDQPEDLEIRVTGTGGERIVDGFDMGIETLTISEPGNYHIEIRQVKASPGKVIVSALRQNLEDGKTDAWRQAENWATISKKSGKLEDIDKSLALWMELGDASSIARSYLKRGSALAARDWIAARLAFEKSLELCRAGFDTRCSAEAANNSGSMSTRLGDFNNAWERLEQARQDWRKLGDDSHEGATLSNLGWMLFQVSDFTQAINYLNQAVALLHKKNALREAIALNNLGLCYQVVAEYDKARGYFERAIKGFTASQSMGDLVRAQTNLGRNYMLRGHLKQAQQMLELAVAHANKVSELQVRANALRNLGQNLWREGEDGDARAQLELALEADRYDGDRRGQSSALHYLGLIAQKSGDIVTARSLFSEAKQIRHDVGLRDDEAESLFALADLEFHANNLSAAHDLTEQALMLLESVRSQVPSPSLRASYYSRKRQSFDLLVDLAMLPGNPNAASDGLLAVERVRGRALMDLLASNSLFARSPEELRHADNQRQLDYLSALLASLPPPEKDPEARRRFQKFLEETQRRFQQLLEEDEALEERLHKSVADQNLAPAFKSVEELQSELGSNGSAVLEYYLGKKHSYLWLIDAHTNQVFTLPASDIIESEAKPVAESLGRILERRRSHQKRAAFFKALQKLSDTLLGKLSGVGLPQHLIVVPDGILHKVPFTALQLPEDALRLGLAHDLVQVPSAAYLLTGAKPRPMAQFPRTVLAIVDPVFSANDPRVTSIHQKKPFRPAVDLPRLVFNKEIEVIDSIVPASRRRILRGFAAGRTGLGYVHLEDYGLLHFSTHALVDDRLPELSWIALSLVDRFGHPVDGLLRPYQLTRFRLTGSIVVLSACDTALGKQVMGEGLVGFSSSLLYAGSSQLVLTLTEIDAEASSHFLSRVYRVFLNGNSSMEHSMTIARRTMAHSRRFADPYYWASFVVVGRPADTFDSGFTSMKDRK